MCTFFTHIFHIYLQEYCGFLSPSVCLSPSFIWCTHSREWSSSVQSQSQSLDKKEFRRHPNVINWKRYEYVQLKSKLSTYFTKLITPKPNAIHICDSCTHSNRGALIIFRATYRSFGRLCGLPSFTVLYAFLFFPSSTLYSHKHDIDRILGPNNSLYRTEFNLHYSTITSSKCEKKVCNESWRSIASHCSKPSRKVYLPSITIQINWIV